MAGKTLEELEDEVAELRDAVRDLYSLERRFKPASFDRDPKPALERILAEPYETRTSEG